MTLHTLRRFATRLLASALLVLGIVAHGTAAAASDLRVGHTVRSIQVIGSAMGETRYVDVHLWYPADVRGFADAPKTVYRSALYGKPLANGRWEPLSWQVEAEVAREDAPIDPNGQAFPVIVFSHGSVNDPIDYARTLELIAGSGFVVAAPAHVNNTQDDERIDFINKLATTIGQGPVFECRDGLPSPCSRPNVARSLKDRVCHIRRGSRQRQSSRTVGRR